MPPTQTPLDPGQPTPEQNPQGETQLPVPMQPSSDAPLSFVPHDPSGQIAPSPARIRTNRYGEMDEHELIHLLDTIEDERARGRFRESIYISFFVWIAIAWFVFYGPRVLWHAPILLNPADVLKQREVTQLNMPILQHPLPTKSSPKPAPKPSLDNQTIKRLQDMTKSAPPPAPEPSTPAPSNTTPPPSSPSAPTPAPRSVPQVIAEAPTPQPNPRTNFNSNSGSAGENIQNALNKAAHARSGNGTQFSPSPSNPLGGGVDILSDTQGVDFDPYLRRIIADIKRNWLPLIPEETRPPISKQGETYIRFTINPDGSIALMHLDGSTHDVAIDHSCWSAIVSEGQFPPLPSQFHGPNLELRIHFLVNKDPGQ